MIILSIRTDKPEAEIGLFEEKKPLDYIKWQADRQLSTTINSQIKELLNASSKSLKDVSGIVIYKGPGSFTGLRIGFSIANALAYSLDVPVVAASGEEWLQAGIKNLLACKNDKIALPNYGSPAKTTLPKK